MTIHTLAADIADRIPEMALDSKINNAELIERMIKDFLLQDHTRKLLKLQEGFFQHLLENDPTMIRKERCAGELQSATGDPPPVIRPERQVPSRGVIYPAAQSDQCSD